MSKSKDYTIFPVVDLGAHEGRNTEGDEDRIGRTELGYEPIVFFGEDKETIFCGEAFGDKCELTKSEAIRLAINLRMAASEL